MDFQQMPTKKYVYVKQHVMDSIKSGQSKVLINPIFMKPPVIHVNPHFKANSTIHVNPNILKPPSLSSTIETPVVKSEAKAAPPPAKPLITPNRVIGTRNKYKVVNITSQKHPFRLDNRLTSKTVMLKKSNKRLVNTSNKNVYVKCNKKVSPSSFSSSRKRLINTKMNIKKVGNLLTIRGEKYKIAANKRTLSLLSNHAGRSLNTLVVNVKSNLYVKNNVGKHLLLSQAKNKSISILKNKLKKSNMSCPFYRKFGKCKGKENGTCIRVHNPNQVSLCPKFLQGACLNKRCLLSHKVSAEKVPTCRFYLEGMCSKDDCPYLHVKINAKAEVCRDFLEGFCKKGAECDKRHQYLCPDFEQIGRCRRKKCQYPHRTVVRDNTVLKSILPKLQTQIKKTKLKPCSSINNKKVLEKLAPSARYYDEFLPKQTQLEVQTKMEKSDKASAETIMNSDYELSKKRPTVGDLPSFIPFMLNEESRYTD